MTTTNSAPKNGRSPSGPDDMTGRVYGQLTVTGPADPTPAGKPRWWCRCTCGNDYPASSHRLIQGRVTRCRQCAAPISKKLRFTLAGHRLGDWRVLRAYGYSKGTDYWKCRCVCGMQAILATADLCTEPVKRCALCQYAPADERDKWE